MKVARFHPKKLVFTQDEFCMPSYSQWEFKNGSLCKTTSYEQGRENCFAPTEAQWKAFWKEIEEIGVWEWKEDYSNYSVLDGNSWSLELKFGKHKLKTRGCNGYPGGDTEYISYSPESAFGRFLAAFKKLTSNGHSVVSTSEEVRSKVEHRTPATSPNLREARRLTTYCSHAPNTSKMWILPDGTVVSIFVQHYEWALANRRRLETDYGIRLDRRNEDDPVRLYLLSKGAVRVNYEHRGGRLTLEASQKHWSLTQQNAYRAIVKKNSEDIDFICVRLLNRSGLIKEEAIANLVGLSNQQKLKQLPTLVA